MSYCNDAALIEHYNKGESRKQIAFNLGLTVADVNFAISRLKLKPNNKTSNSVECKVRRTIEEHQERIHEREMQSL